MRALLIGSLVAVDVMLVVALWLVLRLRRELRRDRPLGPPTDASDAVTRAYVDRVPRFR